MFYFPSSFQINCTVVLLKMGKNSFFFPFPLLSVQFLDAYSSVYDTQFFETPPIAWDTKKKKFTINPFWNCKLYWFNVLVVQGGMANIVTWIFILRQFLYRNNDSWTGIFIPIIFFMFTSQYCFTFFLTYYVGGATGLVESLVKLEERVLNCMRNFYAAHISHYLICILFITDSTQNVLMTLSRYDRVIRLMRYQFWSMPLFSILSAFSGIFIPVCPYGFLVEEIIRGSFFPQNQFIVWTLRVISHILFGIMVLKTCQMLAIFITFTATIAFTFVRIVTLMASLPTKTRTQFNIIVRTYRELEVVQKIGRDFVMVWISLLLTTTFVVIVGFNYVTIKLWGKMPQMVWIMAPYLCGLMFCLAYFLLPAFIKIHALSEVSLMRTRMCRFTRDKSVGKKIVESMRVLGMDCGLPGYRLFRIEKPFVKSFYARVLDNTWNLMVTFPDP